LEIYFTFRQWKNFENPLRIDLVIAMSLVYYFFLGGGTQRRCALVDRNVLTFFMNFVVCFSASEIPFSRHVGTALTYSGDRDYQYRTVFAHMCQCDSME